MKSKIWMDTDIGTDSDDALCLAYLLLRADCELVGISTVGRDSVTRAAIARTLCGHFGQPDIPVVAGCDRPLLPNPYWDGHRVNQAGIVPGTPASGPARPTAALESMRAAIEAAPDEITLLTVGMFSNAALLVATEPKAAGRLKAVYSMGGRVADDPAQPVPECNVMLDAAAAAMVCTAGVPAFRLVPSNVTSRMGLDDAAMRALLSGGNLRIVRDCCEAWIAYKGKPGTGLHDPFTAACMFDPTFAGWERGHVDVALCHARPDNGTVLENGLVSGWTRFSPHADGPHRLAVAHAHDRYMEHLDTVFAAAR